MISSGKSFQNKNFRKIYYIIHSTFVFCIFAFLFAACSSSQRIPGEIRIRDFRYKIPEGYIDLRDYKGFKGVKFYFDVSRIMNSNDPKGIINEETGSVIVFDFIERINIENFYSKLHYQVNRSNSTENMNLVYDPFIPSYIKSLLKNTYSDLITTDQYKLFYITMEAAFIEVVQIVCWQNKYPGRNTIIAAGICRPQYKQETENILISLMK